MTSIEKKFDAVAEYLFAETKEEQESAKAKIKSLMSTCEDVRKESMEQIIRDILLDIGAPDHLTGHKYTVYAIMLAISDSRYIDNVVYGLYPEVAAKFDTTASRVERGIRHLITVAVDRCDMDVLKTYFGNTISPDRGCPTNSEFISRISNIVRMRMQ